MQLISLKKIRQKPGRSEFRDAEKKGDEIVEKAVGRPNHYLLKKSDYGYFHSINTA